MDFRPITSELEFDRARMFQIWAYTVGHSQLLVRSCRDDRFETRIELLFKSVDALHLPSHFFGLTVKPVSDADDVPSWVPRQHGQVYVTEFSGGRGYVVAGAAFVSEDKLGYWEPSAFTMSLFPDDPL